MKSIFLYPLSLKQLPNHYKCPEMASVRISDGIVERAKV